MYISISVILLYLVKRLSKTKSLFSCIEIFLYHSSDDVVKFIIICDILVVLEL